MRFTMAAGGEAGQIQHFDWIPLNDPSSTPQLPSIHPDYTNMSNRNLHSRSSLKHLKPSRGGM